MDKRWVYKPQPDPGVVQQLSSSINVNPYLSTILIQRGLTDFESARQFFRPGLDLLHDPFLMRDMHKAVQRLNDAILHQEKILVYGDYDVDGTTAVALVYSYLKSFYPHCDFYIPDRHAEGYGVSEAGVRWAEANGYTLIIALDLGIKASDMVTLANHKGIDFIICDHHLPDENIPLAVAILDPKRKDCEYPYKELSGAGLGFKLIQAYARTYANEDVVFDYLDLVSVSIASDIVPITGENRVLCFYGLKKLNSNPRPGLKALIDIAGVKTDLDISGVVFTLGPRINAAGRVAHARAAVELLIAQTDEEAAAMAGKINISNDQRREFDLSTTEEALAMIEADEALKQARTTVLYKETWNKGVIGIVASRCIEKFYRPTVILTASNDKITGSARSVHGFDLYQALQGCKDLLDKFGGHKYAAGLTLLPENLRAFQKRFEEVVSNTITPEQLTPLIEIDLQVPFDAVTPKFINILKQMAPFGPESPRPVFEARNVYVKNALSVFKDRHMRFLAGQTGNESVFQAVAFDLATHYTRVANGEHFRMAFTIEENTFNGITSIQFRIKDLKFD